MMLFIHALGSSVPDRGMEQRSGTSLYLQAHGKCKTDRRDNRPTDLRTLRKSNHGCARGDFWRRAWIR